MNEEEETRWYYYRDNDIYIQSDMTIMIIIDTQFWFIFYFLFDDKIKGFPQSFSFILKAISDLWIMEKFPVIREITRKSIVHKILSFQDNYWRNHLRKHIQLLSFLLIYQMIFDIYCSISYSSSYKIVEYHL